MKRLFGEHIFYKFIILTLLVVLAYFYMYIQRLTYLYPEIKGEVSEIENFSFQGIMFKYGEKSYDVSSCSEAIHTITDAELVGKKIVVEGHVCPHYAVYCIFDTDNKEFENTVTGTNLIWRDNDINTAVYAYGPEICTYDGRVIKVCSLGEREFIREMVFSDNGTKLIVTISKNDDTMQTDIIELEQFIDL